MKKSVSSIIPRYKGYRASSDNSRCGIMKTKEKKLIHDVDVNLLHFNFILFKNETKEHP